jgi:MFS transporter, putative metabolite:H+ symporter
MAQTIEAFVGETMDDARMTPIHWRVLALVAGGYFFDVLDLTIFGALVPDMIHSGFISAPQVAVVGSSTLIGLLIGCVGQGEFTDRFGRKAVYQFNLLLYGVATIAAAFSPNFIWLAAFRFIAGIGLGAEQPLCFSYTAEYAPKNIRGRILALMQLIGGAVPWPVGILLALGFRDTIGWRGIWVVIGVGALIIFILRFSLPESPRWLATHGKGQRALDLLKRMNLPAPPLESLAVDAASDTKSDPLGIVLREYPRNVIASMICFFAFFGIANGLGTWLPNIMAGQGFSITKSLTFTLGMTIAYPCSSAFMMFSLERFGRIRTAVTAFILAGLFAAAFASARSEAMLLAVGFVMFFCIQLAGNSMQIFASEVFPTNARASGFGLAHSGGRIGAAIIVPGFLYIQTAWGVPAVFGTIAVMLAVAAVAVTQIGSETRGLALDAIAPPTG